MTDNLTPAQRALRLHLAEHTHRTADEARQARTDRTDRLCHDPFADKVDPDHTLSPDERARRAHSARRAHFTALALRSSRARAARRSNQED